LPELDREYSLYEIAVITRAGTAKRLGLDNKGHLGVGADGDVTIYADLDDREKMFSRPVYVFKDGILVAKEGRVTCERPGKTLYVSPDFSPDIEKEIREHIESNYTISFDHYPVGRDELSQGKQIPCKVS